MSLADCSSPRSEGRRHRLQGRTPQGTRSPAPKGRLQLEKSSGPANARHNGSPTTGRNVRTPRSPGRDPIGRKRSRESPTGTPTQAASGPCSLVGHAFRRGVRESHPTPCSFVPAARFNRKYVLVENGFQMVALTLSARAINSASSLPSWTSSWRPASRQRDVEP